jgi:hypothetical protein
MRAVLPVKGDLTKAKVYRNMFQGFGLSRYFALSSIIATAATAGNTAVQFAQDASSGSENTFENLGYGVGGVAMEAGFAMSAMQVARDQWKQNTTPSRTMYEATRSKNSIYLAPDEKLGGKWRAPKGTKMQKGSYNAATGEFFKHGWKKDILFAGAAIGAGMAVSWAASTAGRMVDNHTKDVKSRSQLNYDTRFFNTQMYDQMAYQQAGQSMGDYSDRIVSVARIYHKT